MHRILLPLAAALLAAAPALAQTRAAPDPARPVFGVETGMHVARITGLAAAPAGGRAATVSADRTMRFWDLEGGAATGVFRLPQDGASAAGAPTAVALTARGDFALVAARSLDPAEGFALDLVATASGSSLFRRSGLPEPWDIAVSQEQTHVAVAYGPGGVEIYSTNGFGLVATLPAASGPVARVAFTSRSRFAALSETGRIELFAIEAQGVVSLAAAEGRAGRRPYSLAWSPDGRSLAVGYVDSPAADVFDGVSLAHRETLAPAGAETGNLAAVGWTVDSAGAPWLAAGGTAQSAARRNLLFLWRWGTGAPERIEVAEDSLRAVAPAGTGRFVFASNDPSLGVVEVEPGPARIRFVEGRRTADFRAEGEGRLLIGPDGARLRARTRQGGTLDFDLGRLSLELSDLADLRAPRTEARGLSVTGFGAAARPLLNGRPFARRDRAAVFAAVERMLSADIAEAGDLIVAGTDFHLLAFDRDGVETARIPLPSAAWSVAISADGRTVAAALGDGSLRWFRRDEAGGLAERAALLALADRTRWVAWTPEGRFAHSDAGGADLVGYHLNGLDGQRTGQWAALGALYRLYYAPGAVAGALTAPPPPEPDAAAVDRIRRRPTIAPTRWCAVTDTPDWTTRSLRRAEEEEAEAEGLCAEVDAVVAGRETRGDGGRGALLTEGPAAVGLTATLRDAGAGAVRVDALVNGRLAGRFDLGPEQQQAARAEAGAAFTFKVPLAAEGRSRVTLRAYNGAGIYSESDPLHYESQPAAPAQDRVLHILAVGVDRYRNPDAGGWITLDFAVKDAESVTDDIRRRAAGRYDRVAEPIRLYDEAATRANILDALRRIAQAADQDDSVVIYLAGHGHTDEAGYIYVTHDVGAATVEETRRLGLDGEALVAAVSDIVSPNLYLMLDTCYAGGVRVEGPDTLAHETGRYVLTATGSQEEALDHLDGTDNGVFAHIVRTGLQGGAAFDGVVDALSLGAYTRRKLEQTAAEIGHKQGAIFKSTGGQLTDFILASP